MGQKIRHSAEDDLFRGSLDSLVLSIADRNTEEPPMKSKVAMPCVFDTAEGSKRGGMLYGFPAFFSYTDGAKDSAFSRRRLIQRFLRKLHRGSRKGRSLSDPAIRRDADRRMDALRHRALPWLHRLAFHFAGFVPPVGTHNMRHTFHCDRFFLDDLRYDRCRFPRNIHGSWHPLRHDCCGYRQRVLFW